MIIIRKVGEYQYIIDDKCLQVCVDIQGSVLSDLEEEMKIERR